MQGLAELKGKEIAVGLQAGKKTKDGTMDMAELGAIHEFGAVIDREARTQTVFHKISSKGKFLRGGRFVKAKRSNFARDVSVGAHSVTIPERRFMRDTFDEKTGVWKTAAWGQVGQIVDGKTTAQGAMDMLGNVMQGDIQRKIVDGPFTANAPSTIRKKKSSRPLIDSGRMRQSIRYVVRKRGSGKVNQ
jgi:hypothetical protein